MDGLLYKSTAQLENQCSVMNTSAAQDNINPLFREDDCQALIWRQFEAVTSYVIEVTWIHDGE